MSLGAWLGVGLVAGLLANWLTGDPRDRRGCCAYIVIGMLGAMLGGVVMAMITGRDWRDFINGFNLETVLVSSLGAIILIILLRLANGTNRRRYR
jgi:uncharacterized membrane protein YeaQ/YmgE (transglycosylase-associated protein family)